MRAVRVVSLDGPGALELADVDEPKAGGIVIDVHAAGVAFPDALLTRAPTSSPGHMRRAPFES